MNTRNLLNQLKKVGVAVNAEPKKVPLFRNGIKDLGHELHVPAPGRVQYYRAEVLPFVPAEIKTQIRFPKAYAQSEKNLRYLD